MLPGFCAAAKDPAPVVRQAHLDLLTVLADCYGDFYGEDMLDQTLPVMMDGLGDQSLSVVEMAEDGCQELVGRFARTRLTLILSLVKEGFTHTNQASQKLHLRMLGTLLLNQFITSNYAKGVRFYGDANNSNNVGEVSNIATVEQEQRLLEVTAVCRITRLFLTVDVETCFQVLGLQVRNDLFSKIYMMRHELGEEYVISFIVSPD